MRYLDGFRDPDAAASLRRRLASLGALLEGEGRGARVMEVCGTHTMAIARYGLRGLLPANVTLISGPGCPVCVTEPGYIDAAIELADRGLLVATFGDLMRVPGSQENMATARARGGRIEICYSPARAIEMTEAEPDQEVVFLAIGFETTAAPLMSMLATAQSRGVTNLSLLTACKRVPPALAALLGDPEVQIDALLCPAHVSAIIGADAYIPFAGAGGVPCVIAGFEPLDILFGLVGILEQLVAGEARVENQYDRVVRPGGNPRAQELMVRYLAPADAEWRGLGMIPQSGLALRPAHAHFDAGLRHDVAIGIGEPHPGCCCGDILKGKRQPFECALFARGCTPSHPLGPCMVSGEGSCAAAYWYERSV